MIKTSKKRILWLDDEPKYIKFFVEFTEESLNVKIDVCSAIESAIYLLQTNYYDLLITDLLIPHRNSSNAGYLLIKEIKSGIWDRNDNNFSPSEMPILIFSGAYSYDFGNFEWVSELKEQIYSKGNLSPDDFAGIIKSTLFREK